MNSKTLCLFGLVVIALFVCADAVPVVLNENSERNSDILLSLEDHHDQEANEEHHYGPRQKRVTCDLLSATVKGVSLNHSACAAHCLLQKYKGGYCSNGVCHCRR